MLTYVFQICQNFANRLLAEHKKTRVPGEPRDFVDCYLDELEKVCVCVCVCVCVYLCVSPCRDDDVLYISEGDSFEGELKYQ